jgi:glycosyltransferase involved in cell wall biosynthesis
MHSSTWSKTIAGSIHTAAQFLIVAVPFLEQDGQIYLEAQAEDGLRRWLSSFASIILAAPVADKHWLARSPGIEWVPAPEYSRRVQYIGLPMAFKVRRFLMYYWQTRVLLGECIDKAKYLQFGIGAQVGDWGGIAAEIAIQKGRKYAVHTDWVNHKMALKASSGQRWRRRAKVRLMAPLMRYWNYRLIRHAALVLLNGRECFNEYAALNPASYQIHDLHWEADPEMLREASERKRAELLAGAPLKICYTGRFASEKAPLDWIKAIGYAHSQGVTLKAVWAGDGPLREQALSLARSIGLNDVIDFPGFVADRRVVRDLISSSHAMLFTHIGAESPRCLIEALMNATPILGYETDYSKNLVEVAGGGLHVKTGNFQELAKLIIRLDRDRAHFANLVQRACRDGRSFDANEVFRIRSELIITHLKDTADSPGQAGEL